MNATTIETLPTGYTLRAPREEDIPAILTLLRETDDAEFGQHDDWTTEDILADWKTIDPAQDAWLVLTPEGALAGYATVFNQGSGKIFGDGYVHPTQHERGIGTALIHLCESRASEMIGAAPEGARVSIGFGANGLNEEAGALFAHEGYAPIRNFYRMRIDMTEPPPAPIWPEGVTLRTVKTGEEALQDQRAVFEAVEEAFSDHWGHVPRTFESWIERVNREDFDPTLWFIAEEDGQIAGFSLCRQTPETGWLNTLGVRRPWRTRGLGMALLLHTFGEFYRRGMPTVVLGVDAQNLTGALRLYERAGMYVSMRFTTYEKELRAGEELATQTLGDE
ncbi:MAG TPA: GNAT family N-acetyltransferase [Ktedonobacterales bacterium]|jgi:mycothiol synthase|nr:GNAT family N-acetyltransferase [Ktedonobacterales bacterium]